MTRYTCARETIWPFLLRETEKCRTPEKVPGSACDPPNSRTRRGGTRPDSVRYYGGFAQDDTHGVEQVDGHADPAGGRPAFAAQAQHSAQLEDHQRCRNDLPGMVDVFHCKPQPGGQAAHALLREEPQVLRRGHEPPSRAG